ncbi:hypothetical protein BGZ60DRAFT_531535 [Tricladium varicosporioides]|nr:hypothetical protein BGZ60DRAFT_531535 [Hymenoscyphus varicosporioides]
MPVVDCASAAVPAKSQHWGAASEGSSFHAAMLDKRREGRTWASTGSTNPARKSKARRDFKTGEWSLLALVSVISTLAAPTPFTSLVCVYAASTSAILLRPFNTVTDYDVANTLRNMMPMKDPLQDTPSRRFNVNASSNASACTSAQSTE